MGYLFIYLLPLGWGFPPFFFFFLYFFSFLFLFLVIGVETKFITIERLIKKTLKRKAAAIILAG